VAVEVEAEVEVEEAVEGRNKFINYKLPRKEKDGIGVLL